MARKNNPKENLEQRVSRKCIKLKLEVGKDIYVPTALYLYHGADDFLGGLCKVKKIWEEYGKLWVSVEERPGCNYRWDYLSEHQEEWKKEYGNRRGRPDPDLKLEFNTDWGWT